MATLCAPRGTVRMQLAALVHQMLDKDPSVRPVSVLEPPPPQPPDAANIPEGQLAEVLPDGLVEALEEQGPEVALDPRWKAARDELLASTGASWGAYILEALVARVR